MPASFSVPRAARPPLLALGLVIVAFVAWTYGALRAANDPGWQDTEPYLGHALYVAEHGGPLAALRDAYAGRYPIVERHFLYPALLAPFAERTPEFFVQAKLLNLAFGTALLASLAWIAWRRFGAVPALVATTLYAGSTSLVDASSHVNHETQFALLALWTWCLLTARAEPAPASPGTPRDAGAARRRTFAWVAAGVLLGLAWLTKASAALLGLGLLAAALAYAGRGPLVTPRFWALVLCGALVSSPLVVRNVIAHGTPVYEGMNSHISWMDSWDELGAADSVLWYDQYGIKRIERNGLPTASEYFGEKTARQVAGRALRGVRSELTRVIPTALGPADPVPPGLSRAIGGGLLLLAAAGWWLRRRSWEAAVTAGWTVAFVAFFSWNTLFEAHRYHAPLIPIWLMYAASALHAALARVASEVALRRGAVLAATSVAALATTHAVATEALTGPQPLVRASPAAWRLLDWMQREATPGSRLVIGPTQEFFGLLWLVDKPLQIVQTPNSASRDEFFVYLEQRDVRYLVLHPENYRGQRGRLGDALANYVAVDARGEIRARAAPLGWETAVVDAGTPSRFVVYRATRAMPAGALAAAGAR
ncbi:MAG: glycosyltransferase family 39 protein [Pseudomonadota bacterium]